MRAPLAFLSIFLLILQILHSENRLDFEPTYLEIVSQAMELKKADAQLVAHGSARWQAEAVPNPTFTVSSDTIENIFDGENKEYFAGVTQLIEFGDKRSARVDIAQAEQHITVWEREILKRKLFGAVLHAFINMAVAQERLRLADEQLALVTAELANLTTKNVDDKIAPIEIEQTEILCQTIRLQCANQQESVTTAKHELQALWDSHAPDFSSVNFPLNMLSAPMPFENLSRALTDTPEMARAQAQLDKATKVYQLERAQRIPDVAVQVGVNAEKKTRNAFFGVGVNIPLPSCDQNRGKIGRAFREKEEAFYAQMDICSEQKAILAALYAEWGRAYEQAIAIRDYLLPQANDAYLLACKEHDEGRCNFTDRSHARDTFYVIQQQYLNAVGSYHHSRAEVYKLTGYKTNTP